MLLVSTRIHSKRCALRAPDIHPVITCNQLAVVSLAVLQLDELQMSMQIIDMSVLEKEKGGLQVGASQLSSRTSPLCAPNDELFGAFEQRASRAYHRVAGRRAQQ